MTAEPTPRGNHLAAVPDTEDERLKALAELVAAAAHHKQQAVAHVNAAKAAEAAIMKLHGKRGTTIQVGASDVTWKKPSSSFAKDEFVKAYPIELNPHFYSTPEPVPALNTEAIPPNLKKTFMRPGQGEGSIVIK